MVGGIRAAKRGIETWSLLAVLVSKEDDSLQFCVDYCRLNVLQNETVVHPLDGKLYGFLRKS